MTDKQTAPKARFTPGPWRPFIAKDGAFQIENDTLSRVVCQRGAMPTAEEGTANAALIAAAPEMLEALKAVDDFVTADRGFHPDSDEAVDFMEPAARKAWQAVRAAIAKAEGCP